MTFRHFQDYEKVLSITRDFSRAVNTASESHVAQQISQMLVFLLSTCATDFHRLQHIAADWLECLCIYRIKCSKTKIGLGWMDENLCEHAVMQYWAIVPPNTTHLFYELCDANNGCLWVKETFHPSAILFSDIFTHTPSS